MARETRTAKTRRGQVQSSDQAIGLNVVAPMNVATAKGQNAMALGKALGLASEAFAQYKIEDNRKMFKQGVQDAISGSPDAEREAEFDAYANGVRSIRARAEYADVSREMVDFIEQNFDPDSMDLNDLNEQMDLFLAERYADSDPITLASVVPLMQNTRDGLNKAYFERIRQAEQEKNLMAFSKNAQLMFEQNGDVDGEALQEQAKQLFGPSFSNQAVASAIADLAAKSGRPELLNRIPERAANTEIGRQIIADGTKRAEDRRLENLQNYRIELFKDKSLKADQGAMVFDDVLELLGAGVSEEKATTLYVQSQKNSMKGDLSSTYLRYFLSGEAYRVLTDEGRQDTIDLIARTMDEDQTILLASANGILPTVHKNLLKTASPVANPAVFQQAAELYSKYASQDRNYAAVALPKEQVALYEAFNILTRDAQMAPLQAAEHLQKYDPSEGRNILQGRSGRELREAFPSEFDRWGWSDDLMDTPLARRPVEQMAALLYGTGSMTEDQALERAFKWFHDRYAVVDNVPFPSELVPEDHEDMMEWFKTQKLGEDADGYVVRKNQASDLQDSFTLTYEDGLPLFARPELTFTWAEVNSAWQEHKAETQLREMEEMTAQRKVELKAEAERRVIDSMEVDVLIEGNFPAYSNAKRKKYERLSAEQRQKLVNEEMDAIVQSQREAAKKAREANERAQQRYYRQLALEELTGTSSGGYLGVSTSSVLKGSDWFAKSEKERERLLEERAAELREADAEARRQLMSTLFGE